jgi:DNA polymerase-3 subunit alpha
MSDADMLRKAMGKKNVEMMERYRKQFVEGAVGKGIPAKVAESIYAQMAQFAGYGFNKSHSAAYALIAYQTAYLKANYPVEYMAALLGSEMGNAPKLAVYIDECRRMNIPVLPPDVNLSELKFAVVGKEIRFGMAAVKNAGENAIKAIITEREANGVFSSLFDLCARVDSRVVNKRVIESLVKCGAFDTEDAPRSRIFAAVDMAVEQGQTLQRDKQMGQELLFDSVSEDEGLGPIRYPDAEDWTDFKQLAFEKEVLGLFITGHPLARHADQMRALATVDSVGLKGCKDDDGVVVGGIVSAIKTYIPKRKQERMAFVTIEDMDGMFETVVFSDLYSVTSEILVEDALVVIAGRVNYRDGEPKIIAEEIVPFEKAEEKFARSCHVNAMKAGIEEATLERLVDVVSKNEGRCRLFIHCKVSGAGQVIIES